MFTYVKLKNYRSLDNVVFDLKETKDKVKRLVAVYGENGCGKTNLLKSFYFLRMLLDSFTGVEFEEKFNESFSKTNIGDFKSIIMGIFEDKLTSNIFKSSRTIDCDEDTEVEFGFAIDGYEGFYKIVFNDEIVFEKLYYFTGKQSGVVFEVSKESIKDPKLSPAIFKSVKIRNEVKEQISKYWGKHSLLAITYDMYEKLNEEYVEENINQYLYDFHDMIIETSILIEEAYAGAIIPSSKKINFIEILENGEIDKEKEWLLNKSEIIINDFFTQTYSDIKKVIYKREALENKIKYHLMFYKNINGKVRLIPVEQESTGTRKVLRILKKLFGAFCGCTVIIDEIDNGIHDLLLKVIVDSMKKYITGQLIFTTHNTSLLESLEPKMVYIINGNYDGNKEIVCLSEYKIQDHNSPRARYMKGLYGGIPFIDNVDYIEIINNLKSGKQEADK